MSLRSYLGEVAGAIRSKTEKEDPINAQNFPDEIKNIETGIDTSYGNITSDDVLLNKIAYSQNKRIIGTMPNNSDVIINPTLETQNLNKGYYNSLKVNPVTSEIDGNIIPENIKEGVTILGVEGRFSASEGKYSISEGKTVFKNIVKIVGTIQCVNGEYIVKDNKLYKIINDDRLLSIAEDYTFSTIDFILRTENYLYIKDSLHIFKLKMSDNTYTTLDVTSMNYKEDRDDDVTPNILGYVSLNKFVAYKNYRNPQCFRLCYINEINDTLVIEDFPISEQLKGDRWYYYNFKQLSPHFYVAYNYDYASYSSYYATILFYVDYDNLHIETIFYSSNRNDFDIPTKNVFFPTYDETKCIYENNLYELNGYTRGELIKENVFEKFTEGEQVYALSNDYYCKINKMNNTSSESHNIEVFYFDSEQNEFTMINSVEISSNSNSNIIIKGLRAILFGDINYIAVEDKADDYSYKINGQTYIKATSAHNIGKSSEVLENKKLYDINYNQIVGSMTNHGNVVVTATSYQQVLSEGYYTSITIPELKTTTVSNNTFYGVYEDIGFSIQSIPKTSSTHYDFELNNKGYYESKNKDVNSSFAICKVQFNLEQERQIIFDVINSGESNYDYGIFSKIDTELALSNTADNSSLVEKSYKGESSTTVKTLTYTIPEGEHFIYIKFIKDGGGVSGNDSLQFKIQQDLMFKIYTAEDLEEITDMEEDDMANIYNRDSNTTRTYKYNGSSWNEVGG